jgi:hypothetical protein
MPWSENSAPIDRVYRAKLIEQDYYNGPTYTESETPDLTIFGESRYLSVALAITAGPSSTATATVTPSVSGTADTIKIRSVSGAQIASCTSGSSCTAPVSDGTYYATVEEADGSVFGESQYLTLNASAIEDAAVEGINTYTLAEGFESADALCDTLLTGPGTHTAGSSLSDQYLACTAAAPGGTHAALKAVTALAGASAVLLYLTDVHDNRADPSTGIVTAPPQPDPPTEPQPGPNAYPRPFPAPLLSSQQDADDVDIFKANNPSDAFVDRAQAKRVLQTCETLTTRENCMSMPIFVPGDAPLPLGMPQTTKHDRQAIDPLVGGKDPILKWTPKRKRPAEGWYDSPANNDPPNDCTNRVRSITACDEYPFRSTSNAGPGASLKGVSRSESTNQGNRLSAFYRYCRLQTTDDLTDGPPFIVVPAPAHSKLPTMTHICNGRR